MSSPPGPTWVGIGSQRSGTTWFTRMLTSHPMVTLGRGGRKEQHFFGRFTLQHFTTADATEYASMFSEANGGEFTPAYMRQPWVAELLHAACPRPPLIIALVRDPLGRFASSIRWQMSLHGSWDAEGPLRRSTLATRWAEQAMLGSLYGPQLAAWRDVWGVESMLVIQYEKLRSDPQRIVHQCWRRLGLGPVPLRGVANPSRTATRPNSWTPSPSIAKAVVAYAKPAIDQSIREWNLDVDLWDAWSTAVADADQQAMGSHRV